MPNFKGFDNHAIFHFTYLKKMLLVMLGIQKIIQEMLLATTSERQGRIIDFDGAGSMEAKKQEGYF
jgi:hypothetical protein